MPWTDQLIHFIDFEGSTVSGILEYGVVTMRGDEVVETATRLCRSTGRVRIEDVAVHGIEADAVASEAPFAEAFEYFTSLRKTGPLAAHFAQAENTMIKSVWAYPPACPDWVRPESEAHDWGPWVDTGKLYPELYPQIRSAKLGDLIAAAGLQKALDQKARQCCPSDRCHYHAALYDALAGALLLARLAADPQVAKQSLVWLLQMSTRDAAKRAAMTQDDLFS
ncbi:MAG: hypothetical protein SynsKO_22690 [Synoicihabitans sp.]